MDSNDIPETKKLRKGQDPETSQGECAVKSKAVDFPEEVLEMIFSHLSDPKDLTAVSNTSSQFNRILKPTQPLWAFCKVLPLIFSELDKKDILNCRLVSKEWNKSVDNFLQTQPRDRTWAVYPCQPTSEAIDGHGDAYGRNHPPYRPQYETYLFSKDFRMTLRDSDDVNSLMEEMTPHPRNPFVLKDVCFDNSFSEGEDYWIAVLAFLSKLGQHIWHVHLAPNLNEHQRYHLAHNYSILQRALSLMPNLRSLSIHGFERDPLGYDADRRMMNSVRKYIRANPLPELPHLHTLSEILPRGPNPVMAELMKYSGQLRKLDSMPYVWFKNPPHFQGLPLSEMRDLHLNFNLCYCSWRNLCRSLVAPNLAKLHLIIWEDWEIEKLLKPLREGLPSLVYLALGLRARCKDFKSSAPPEFGLGRIKTVEIEDRPFVPYDRIFNHLPGLEYVLVCHSTHLSRIKEVNEEDVEEQAEEEEEEESEDEDCGTDDETSSDEEMPEVEVVENKDVEQVEIRRLMLSGRMYESDIWNRLTFLKEFTVARMCDNGDTENDIETTEQYTRDMYNQKLEQRK